ncbi:MAG: Site-specific recombinase [Holophagaceae bacterium]|nr:Site-specific recombinase [Holophagaceae bacterium]
MSLSDPRLDELLSDGPKLEPLLRWLLEASPRGSRLREAPRTARLRLLQEALVARGLEERLSEAWNHTSAIRLLSETGLPDRTTLLGEGFLRVVDRLIPRLDPEGDLYALLDRLDLGEEDALWLESLPREARTSWGRLLSPPPEAWAHAASLLAHRAAAVGLSRDLLALDPEGSDADSPFFTLTRAVRDRAERPQDPDLRRAWEHCHAACARALAQAHDRLEEQGVSSDLVFRLELLDAQLERIAQLLAFLSGEGDGAAFAGELVRGSASQHGLLTLLRTTVKRLARKVVEHTGDTGEHYIARNRREWWAMARSAAGGGVLTAGTALFKYGFAALPLAPLLLGASLATNYTASFFLMQLLGFSLASKQPAMTAAALARALESGEDQAREVDLVAAITRTQVIATVGNVCATIPTSLAISALWIWQTGHGPLGPESAAHALHGNHPFHGWTLFFAAVTGVLLWLSSLAAGWAANWSAYRRLPEALAQSHRIRSLAGGARAEALGRFVHRHISGFIGYVALGGLLVFVPMAFAFAGIHLEVRHVTLQAASLALGSASLWAQDAALGGALPWRDVLWGLLGIALIGVMNFTVSFALALWTALRARDLGGRARRSLWWGILKAFNRQPGRFLLAPRTGDTLDSPHPGDPHA